MLFHSNDAPMLVVVSLLCVSHPDSADETAKEINKNLPECCINGTNVRRIYEYLYSNIPEWFNQIMALEPKEEGFLRIQEFLHYGLLVDYTIPPDEITANGLLMTLGRIAAYAREHAVKNGTLELRSFGHAEKGDEFGDPSDTDSLD